MHQNIPLNEISQLLSTKIRSVKSIGGGDISSAYLLQSDSKTYFMKANDASFALQMFRAEQRGLKAIEATHTIAVPHVHCVMSTEDKAVLVMDFIESKRPSSSDFRQLGTDLARLHQCTQSHFGFADDNFIGSLPQSNHAHPDWSTFYWHERIKPQLQRAQTYNLLSTNEIPTESMAISVFIKQFSDVEPSLLHGDLWGGNYLIATDGTPFLIDPATYYGHHMVDIAMSRLFGGFANEFYEAYHAIIPKPKNYSQQIELYQLYYLLVHLNLFGSGYYSGVSSILRRYFQNQ